MSDAALLLLRVAAGAFFAISGYHKLFNPQRHKGLRETLARDKVPAVRFNEWWVPGWEFAGGISLALGFLTPLCALALLTICAVACVCEAKEKVQSYSPIDKADFVDDLLYLPEVLYCVILLAILLSGPGAYSLDSL